MCLSSMEEPRHIQSKKILFVNKYIMKRQNVFNTLIQSINNHITQKQAQNFKTLESQNDKEYDRRHRPLQSPLVPLRYDKLPLNYIYKEG